MLDDPFASLSFIAGPAILTNASAALQNGATTRYHLAVTQWREFQASLATRGDGLAALYVAPETALKLARRRIRLQLAGLNMISAAVALFAATAVLGLAGAMLVRAGGVPASTVGVALAVAAGGGLAALLAAIVTFFLESACGGALLRLHRTCGGPAETPPPCPTPAS